MPDRESVTGEVLPGMLDPLPEQGADDLLTSVLGTDSSLDALKRTLVTRTEGNPLFLEESVRALVETKALVGERGAYQLARDATAAQVPTSVQAILAARIDRLSPEDKRLLQAASGGPRSHTFSVSARVRSPCPPPARRYRDASRPVRRRTRRGPLSQGARASRARRDAPPRRSLPPRSGQAVPAHGPGRGGSRAHGHRDSKISRDRHDVLIERTPLPMRTNFSTRRAPVR
jgi:hypothetical protein